jgi:hypothetical protein
MIKAVSQRAQRAALAFLLLATLAAPLPALASQSILLSWYPVAEPEIAGYHVYYGTSSRNYSHQEFVDQPSIVISDLAENRTYFFAVSTVGSGGLESALSDEISYAVPPPPSGSYSGLFYEEAIVRPNSAGSFTLSVTPNGTYTGKVRLGIGQYSFTGKLDASYQSTVNIQRRNSTPLFVQFNLGTGDDTEKIFGNVSDGVWISTLSGNRIVFNSKTQRAPYAGNYTLIVPGQKDDPGQPDGNSYGTVRVGPDGIARFAGALADKTKVTLSAPLSRLGQWPVWVPLNGGRGLLLGWMQFTPGPGEDIDGDLNWVKAPDVQAKYYPAGFMVQSHAVGSAYVAPSANGSRLLNLTNGTITFGGGNLDSGITNGFTMSAAGKAARTSGSSMTIIFSSATGRFNGTVIDPATGRSFSFGGAVLQSANTGYGFLSGTNQSSEVTLGQ